MKEIFSSAMEFLDTILVAGQKHDKLTEKELARKTLGYDETNIFQSLKVMKNSIEKTKRKSAHVRLRHAKSFAAS